MKGQKWEDLCTNCGLCCHEKVLLDDMLLIDTARACEFYDAEKRCCRVYEERFQKCPRCLKVNLFRAMFATYLPPTCGYVLWARRHHLRLCRARICIAQNGTLDFVDGVGQ